MILSNTFQTIILHNSDVLDQLVCACQIAADFISFAPLARKAQKNITEVF